MSVRNVQAEAVQADSVFFDCGCERSDFDIYAGLFFATFSVGERERASGLVRRGSPKIVGMFREFINNVLCDTVQHHVYASHSNHAAMRRALMHHCFGSCVV